MAFPQYGAEEDMNVGVTTGDDGSIKLIPDKRVPMYRPRLMTGDPSDRRYWQQVWTSLGQPFKTSINAASQNNEFYFTLASEDPNLFLNWQDSFMALDMQLERNATGLGTGDQVQKHGNDGAAGNRGAFNDTFMTNSINKVAINNLTHSPSYLWYHGTHTFWDKVTIKHITSGKVIESLEGQDVLTQASLYGLPRASKDTYLEKFGASLVDLNYPAYYMGATAALVDTIKTQKIIAPSYTRFPGQRDPTAVQLTVGGKVGAKTILGGNYPADADTVVTPAGFGLPIDPQVKMVPCAPSNITAVNPASNDFEFKTDITASANVGIIPALTTTNAVRGFMIKHNTDGAGAGDAEAGCLPVASLQAMITYTAGNAVEALNMFTGSVDRTDAYFVQLSDLFGKGVGPKIRGSNVPNTPYITKMVAVPSNYLNNGQLIYLKAEPLEIRFTMNAIQKVLTVIHGTFTSAAGAAYAADTLTKGNIPSEVDLNYAINLQNICFHCCFEQMPPEIINKLNARWTDPNVGLIKDYIRYNLIIGQTITPDMGSTRYTIQCMANDIHQLKQILIVFRLQQNDADITKDRYQFTDGSVWGDEAPTYFKSVQYQIGVDYYPALPIMFDRTAGTSGNNLELIRYHTNEVLYQGNSAFIDNMLDKQSYMGELPKDVGKYYGSVGNGNLNNTSSLGPAMHYWMGGLGSKFMIGYDFSRHAHSLRSGISLESRPLNILLEATGALKANIIPYIYLFHEATFTITPTAATLLT